MIERFTGIIGLVLIFGIAFGVSGLILLVHRVILPKFGIWVGSEKKKHHKR